jgi:Tfp pilus assembly protein PilN
MINLLPPEHAATIRYGRQNTVLRKWLFGALASIAVLVLILISGWIYIDRQSKDLHKSVDLSKQQLQAQNLSKVQSDAKAITGDLRVINEVLGNEIRFSDLIQAIGRVMPKGSVLDSLSLNKVSGAIDLSASSLDNASAAQIAANLSDPSNGIFSQVDIVSINCTTKPNTPYICDSDFKALFSPTTKNKFLSVPRGGS